MFRKIYQLQEVFQNWSNLIFEKQIYSGINHSVFINNLIERKFFQSIANITVSYVTYNRTKLILNVIKPKIKKSFK